MPPNAAQITVAEFRSLFKLSPTQVTRGSLFTEFPDDAIVAAINNSQSLFEFRQRVILGKLNQRFFAAPFAPGEVRANGMVIPGLTEPETKIYLYDKNPLIRTLYTFANEFSNFQFSQLYSRNYGADKVALAAFEFRLKRDQGVEALIKFQVDVDVKDEALSDARGLLTMWENRAIDPAEFARIVNDPDRFPFWEAAKPILESSLSELIKTNLIRDIVENRYRIPGSFLYDQYVKPTIARYQETNFVPLADREAQVERINSRDVSSTDLNFSSFRFNDIQLAGLQIQSGASQASLFGSLGDGVVFDASLILQADGTYQGAALGVNGNQLFTLIVSAPDENGIRSIERRYADGKVEMLSFDKDSRFFSSLTTGTVNNAPFDRTVYADGRVAEGIFNTAGARIGTEIVQTLGVVQTVVRLDASGVLQYKVTSSPDDDGNVIRTTDYAGGRSVIELLQPVNVADPSGAKVVVSRTELSRDTSGNLTGSTKTEPQADGSITATVRDANGVKILETNSVIDDFGARLDTTVLANGVTSFTSFDADGNRVKTIEQEFIGGVQVTRTFDGNGNLGTTVTRQVWDDGSSITTGLNPDGSSVATTRDSDGNVTSVTGESTPQDSFSSAIRDINAIVQAANSGRVTPPVLSAGLNFVNNQVNPVVRDPATGSPTQTLNNVPLFTTTAVVSGLASIYSVHKIFSQGGNEFGKLTTTLNGVVALNRSANAVLSTSSGLAGQVANTTLNTVANTVSEVLPFLNIALSLKNGDFAGAAIEIVAMQFPVIGQIYAAYKIISALIADAPDAWAVGRVQFDIAGGTGISVSITGDASGPGKVSFLMEGNKKPVNDPEYFGGLVGYLNSIITAQQAANPDRPLGIIPQRLPTIAWNESRLADPGYSIVDIDSVTGAQRLPGLRYNDNFTPYNADATDPAQRRNVFERAVDSALDRQAIAPMWEVRTARMRQDLGDANAGLTEEQLAGKLGQSVLADANGNRVPGVFRPVVLDLGGDGRISLVPNSATEVAFDWNNTGFKAQTSWIAADDGFLTLDRNVNGSIDSGRELFSNGLVSDAARGVRSLSWIDANGDGVIDASDPVFAELRVWQDANLDGVQDSNEAKTLDQLGITKIDYSQNRFVRNGQEFSLQSPDFDASTQGVSANPVTGGIQIVRSNGSTTLLVTSSQVTNTGGGTGQGTNFTVANETINSYEDGLPPPTNGGLVQGRDDRQPITIPFAQLLANDLFGTSNAGLTISAIRNVTHGTATVNATDQTIRFNAEANYAGTAEFEYEVLATNGQTRVGRATLQLEAVNDRPTTDFSLDDNLIYGYTPVYQVAYVIEGSGDNQQAVQTSTYVGDLPIYEAYVTAGGYVLETRYRAEYVSDDVVQVAYSVETTQLVDSGIRVIDIDKFGGFGPLGYVDIGGVRIRPTSPSFDHSTVLAREPGNDGRVVVSDVDSLANAFRYVVADGYQPLYGEVVLNEDTGSFTYTGNRFVNVSPSGAVVNGNVLTDDHLTTEPTSQDTFVVRIVDTSDPTGATFSLQQINVTHFGPLPAPAVSSGAKKPIAIDLNGDGFEFIGVDDSNVFLDVNGDGVRRRSAWVGPNDGLLAYDENSSGTVDLASEVSFARFLSGAQTDLAGLRAFDTNSDGKFSAADAKWGQFGVWRDANSNGISDPGEFQNLTHLGIESIELQSDGQFRVINGQTVHGAGILTRTDGTKLAFADVSLAYRNVVRATTATNSVTNAALSNFSRGETFGGTAGRDIVFGTAGNDVFKTGADDDIINDDAGNDNVDAGAGNDTVFTGVGDDFIDGGDGDDTLFAGAGNDVTIGNRGNDTLVLEGGNDIGFGGAGNDLISGGSGNDLLSGDTGNDRLIGEGGRDQLLGGTGNDELWGLEDDDALYGGEGHDLLVGGLGADLMEGGLGNDTFEVDDINDVIVELVNEGQDKVRSFIAFTLSENFEDLELVGNVNLSGAGNAKNNNLYGNDGINELSGLAGDDRIDGGLGSDTMRGGLGDDYYVVDNAADLVIENVDEGVDTVQSSLDCTLTNNVENLVLTGLSSIDGTGNNLNNVITGNDANNKIDGGFGSDRMEGGKGNDQYFVDSSSDQVIERLAEGYDTVNVVGLANYTLGENIEALRLGLGAGNGNGNLLDNYIRGNEDANALNGFTGADVLAGEGGDDIYYVDNALDVVIERLYDGNDTVRSSVSYVLGTNLENIELIGSADVNGSGNEEANVLLGNTGNNQLDGGLGADRMAGGKGNDTYIVDSVLDLVTEQVDEGIDKVLSSVTYTLGSNVENLELSGSAISGTGNALNNVIVGNASDNIVDGGEGADTLRGGLGNDSYYVDNTGDVVSELENSGFDNVQSHIDYVLPDFVEQLNLLGTATRATGNQLNNLLFGNELANVLDGSGGADQMSGGLGDDRYIVDYVGDTVTEAANAGNDLVISSVNFALSDNVEHLFLTGSSNIDGSGNDIDNVIVGNTGANLLQGGGGNDTLAGGTANDTLNGGSGDDIYVYNQGEGRDLITDSSGLDTVKFGAGISIDSVSARTVTVNGVSKLVVSILDVDGQETTDGLEWNLSASGGTQIEQFVFANGQTSTLAQVLVTPRSLNGTNANDSLVGDRRDDTISGSNGNDVIYGRTGNDVLNGENGADRLFGEGGNDSLYGGNGSDELWAGVGNDYLDGGDGADLLAGGDGDDQIAGGNGADVVIGGRGTDNIDTGNDSDFIDAGDGNDVISAGNSSDFVSAGRGNDTINLGLDKDILAFNRGDGADTVITSSYQSDTLSLGGGIRYADITLSKIGSNLLLNLGQGDSISFKDWYLDSTRKNFAVLQVITAATGGDYSASSTDRLKNRGVVTFNFEALVAKFDQARTSNASLVNWSVDASLNSVYLNGSNTQAIGGDFAYRYATTSSYGDLDFAAIGTRLSGLSGSVARTLIASTTINPWVALQAGTSLFADQNSGLPSPITVVGAPSAEELLFASLASSPKKPSWTVAASAARSVLA